MDPHQAFEIAGIITMPMWLLMIIAPRWRATEWLINYRVAPLFLATLYALFIGQALINNGMMDFSSLKSVMQLFTLPNAAIAGWIHYLAFDLLIGMWMIEQNRTLQFPHLVMVPCLILTFIFGPVGFLLFTIVKTTKTSRS
jgi:hypothetical protein